MMTIFRVLIPTTIVLAIANAGAINALGYCKPISRAQLSWLLSRSQGTEMRWIRPALNPSCKVSDFDFLPFDWDPSNGLVLISDQNDRFIAYDFYLGGNR